MYPSGRPPTYGYGAQPNYGRRRLVVGLAALVVLWIAIKILGALWGAAFGGDDDTVAASSNSTTTPSSTTSTTAAPPPLPACVVGEKITEHPLPEEWQQTLIDTERKLPDDYEAPSLVDASQVGFTGDYQVRSNILDDLGRLRQAASDNNTPIDLIAAHRNIEDQATLFAQRVDELGQAAAIKRVAEPGHSEHHLGTTVDFRTVGAADVFQSWADEPAGQFVLAHSWEYGFVNSYPRGKEAVTCHDFEPWHYRYVGIDEAKRIHDSGLTLREFLWKWQTTDVEPS